MQSILIFETTQGERDGEIKVGERNSGITSIFHLPFFLNYRFGIYAWRVVVEVVQPQKHIVLVSYFRPGRLLFHFVFARGSLSISTPRIRGTLTQMSPVMAYYPWAF